MFGVEEGSPIAFSDADRPRGIVGVEVAATPGGIAVLDEHTRRLHQLAGLSASVWVLCDGRTRVGEMAKELGTLFGVAEADLRPSVDEALESLALAGLIEGVEVPILVPDERVEAETSDGTRILAGPADPCGPEADRSVWAGSLVLRIGEHRDALLAVQGDSDATLDALRTLLARWIEPDPPAEVSTEKSMFSVWATPLDDQPTVARTVPQLRRGSRAIARSRDSDDVLRALALALGNAHVQHPDDGFTWIGLRAFVRDTSLVFADIDPPEMVSDPRLAARGVSELPILGARVSSSGEVSVAPPLPDLGWSALAVDPPDPDWTSYELRGVVSMRPYPRSDEEQLAKIVRYSHTADWFRLVTGLANSGTLVHALSHREARHQIERLLA